MSTISNFNGYEFYAATASLAISASYASTSSQAISSSYASTSSQAISSSYALTASFALNGGGGGGGGSAIATYVQSVDSDSWTFTHNLGEQYPIVTVYKNNDQVIIPGEIIATDVNTLTLTFSEAIQGTAVAAAGTYIGTTPSQSISSSYSLFAEEANFARTGSFSVQINEQTGSSYTLTISDAGKYIRIDNASPITLTVPTSASVGFDLGTVISVEQQGAGVITFTTASGVTINTFDGNDTAGQYAAAQLIKVSTNIWTLIGGVS